ncbi:MAG: hypothetical protein GX379_08980 [Clostridiales bacterium]|jgi:hypothetical protein|nr:hypothetical protein [Clostridiales bacterium]
MKLRKKLSNIKRRNSNASLTVEASLILPLFLFLFMCFLYILQTIIFQESLQKAMTEAGLSMARAAYVYSDFQDADDIESIESSFLDEKIQTGLQEITGAIVNRVGIKYAVESKLSKVKRNHPFIVGGFDGISFDGSKVLQGNNDIDIIARYRIRIPIKLFDLLEMDTIQRVRLRGWNGHQLTALYSFVEEEDNDETMVYVTESGTVYHRSRSCSHISLSVEAIIGKPTWQRNKNGGKYYECKACCRGKESETGTFYITAYGDRYHSDKECSKIKRNVKKIPLSEVGDRLPCKRCGK